MLARMLTPARTLSPTASSAIVFVAPPPSSCTVASDGKQVHETSPTLQLMLLNFSAAASHASQEETTALIGTQSPALPTCRRG